MVESRQLSIQTAAAEGIAGKPAPDIFLRAAELLSVSADRCVVVEDAVGSGAARDQLIGVQRMRDAGATICTAEGVAFEWCETAEAPQSKTMSRLIRTIRLPRLLQYR